MWSPCMPAQCWVAGGRSSDQAYQSKDIHSRQHRPQDNPLIETGVCCFDVFVCWFSWQTAACSSFADMVTRAIVPMFGPRVLRICMPAARGGE